MNKQGLGVRLLTAFIAAAAALGAVAAVSASFAGKSWESFALDSENKAAEIYSASETARKIRCADADILAAFAVRDPSAAENYISDARDILSCIEAESAKNKYLCGSESINAIAEASDQFDSIAEMISAGDLPRAGKIYFTEYQSKLRAAADYAERVFEKLSAESTSTARIEKLRSRSQRLTVGMALLGISVILFFALYIDTMLRKQPAPVPETEIDDFSENDKYDKYEADTPSEYDGIKFLTDKLSDSECVIDTLVNSINLLAEGDPDAAADGIYPECYANALSAVRKMKARLKFISSQINRAAEFVSAESVRVSDNAEELSAAAEEQGAAAGSLFEHSAKISELLEKSSEISEKIRTGSEGCISIAEGCSEQLKETAGSLETLRSSLDELSRLASSVADIASKSNMLALNTAMNVSRGEMSSASLAASADEARSLAMRSEEVSSDAGSIKESCSQAVSSAASDIEKAISAVSELESCFESITRDLLEMNTLSSDQSQAVAGVKEDLAKLTGFVHLSKNAYEEYAASGRMLLEQTNTLRKIMPQNREAEE